jgi:cytosine/adenosine deaminase-related metal-dependent hydrolase
MEMFRAASGSLYEFLKAIGRPMNDCGERTPLELFLGARGGRALPQWIVAHLNELTESDFELLQRSERRFHVVHSPRSHVYFQHRRFPFEKLQALGFNVCLGTDSLASNESLSLFDEMRAFRRSEPGISPDKILEMVTVNPAAALHQESALGMIRRGFRADFIAVRCNDGETPFEQILEYDASVDWRMVNGKP